MELVSEVIQAVTFGEGMIELSRRADRSAQIGFGGDTLNSAVYLARLGVDVGFMTAVGVDPWSEELVAAWRDEGVKCPLVLRHPSRLPGVYAISLDDSGERSFSYWRSQSAARVFFECPGAEEAVRSAAKAKLLLLSAISLAVLEGDGRSRALELVKSVRKHGGKVAFDPNYRSRLWPSVTAYRHAVQEIAPHVDIALPSFDDEAAVWEDPSAEHSLARWQAYGVPEVVVKNGVRGALTGLGLAPAEVVAKVADTTGAGDSFNAGYLARRLAGEDVLQAAAFGAQVAACVVQHSGAIAPRAALAAITDGGAR